MHLQFFIMRLTYQKWFEIWKKKSCNFFPVKNNGSLHLVITTLGQTIQSRLNIAYQKVKKPFFSWLLQVVIAFVYVKF